MNPTFLIPPYRIDQLGYYWMDEDGLKFRPIVLEDGKITRLTPSIVLARAKRREKKWKS